MDCEINSCPNNINAPSGGSCGSPSLDSLNCALRKESRDIVCPFCGEKDFDALGLRLHLTQGYCIVFDLIPPTTERQKQRGLKLQPTTGYTAPGTRPVAPTDDGCV